METMSGLAAGGISLIIPVYNEEDNIQKSVSDGLAMLPGLAGDYEIVIVESGSTDNTCPVTDRLAAENPRVRVIHQGAKLGLGSALKAGFSAARYASIFYIDGDNPFRMSDFARGFPLLKEADIVCGYRTNQRDSFKRALYSKAFNFLMRTLFGVRARDTQIGFKLIHKAIFERVKLTTDSMFIDAELLIKAQRAGYRIAELGVEYLGKPSGKSTVTFREMAKIGADLIKYRFGGLK
jgi:glycosyltransferase involved in cell wall biosynthesis